jgi:hypothetical protein
MPLTTLSKDRLRKCIRYTNPTVDALHCDICTAHANYLTYAEGILTDPNVADSMRVEVKRSLPLAWANHRRHLATGKHWVITHERIYYRDTIDSEWRVYYETYTR